MSAKNSTNLLKFVGKIRNAMTNHKFSFGQFFMFHNFP